MKTQSQKERSVAKAIAVRKLAAALCGAGLLALPGLAAAQAAPVPLMFEGAISGVVKNADGSVTLTVFGTQVVVQPGVPVATPTAILTNDQLADPTPFPGRSEAGFIGGTAIVDGLVINGVATPLTVFVEPSENVLLGEVTANGPDGLVVQGVPMVELNDPRIPSDGVHNIFGFPILPSSIPVGTGIAAEGYFAGGAFHHFLIEADAGTLVDTANPAVSVTRARCVPGGELRVQGGAYLPDNATVEVRNALTGFVFGTATAVPDPAAPGFGAYLFRTSATGAAVNDDGACPSEVRVVRTAPATPAVEAVAAVSGVVAPPPAPTTNTAPVAAADVATTNVGLVTEVDLIGNDVDAEGNIDPSSIQLDLSTLPTDYTVSVTNNLDGTVAFQADRVGTVTFSYTIGDTGTPSLRSAPASVTVNVQAAAVDTVSITRANYRADKGRWNLRGASNRPAVTVTATLVRTGQVIATAQADATGAWIIDAQGTGVTAIQGDVVRITSSGGGNTEGRIAIQ